MYLPNRSKPKPAPQPRPRYPKVINKRRVPVTIFCKNEETFDEVKVFKDDLKGLPTNKMRFIEVYDESIDEYHLIKVDYIEDIEYSKDEWEED